MRHSGLDVLHAHRSSSEDEPTTMLHLVHSRSRPSAGESAEFTRWRKRGARAARVALPWGSGTLPRQPPSVAWAVCAWSIVAVQLARRSSASADFEPASAV